MDGNKYVGLIIYRIRTGVEFLLLKDSLKKEEGWNLFKQKINSDECDEKGFLKRAINQTLGISSNQVNFFPEYEVQLKRKSGNFTYNCIYYLAQLFPNTRIYTNNLNYDWSGVTQACELTQDIVMREALLNAAEVIMKSVNSDSGSVKSLADDIGRMHFFIDGHQQNESSNYRNDNRFNNNHARSQNVEDHNRFQNIEDHNRFQNIEDRNRFQNIEGHNRNTEQSRYYNNDYSRQFQKYNNYGYSSLQLNSHYSNNSYQSQRENDAELRDYPREKRESNTQSLAMSPLYKTRLCARFLSNGTCQYGDNCTFAHGKTDLRGKPSYNNDPMRSNPNSYPNYYSNNKLNFHINKVPMKDPSSFYSNSPLENIDETIQDQRFDLSGNPSPSAYRPLDQRPKINSSLAILAPPFFRHSEALSHGPQQSSSQFSSDISQKVAPFSNENVQSSSSSQKPMKKAQEVKPVSLKELLKDPGVEKVTPTQTKKPLIDEKLISEFRQIIDNPDIPTNEELRELTRMEFRYNLSKLQIFTLLIESLLSVTYDKKKLNDRLEVFAKFILSPYDQEVLLKALENILNKSESLMNSAIYVFKDLYDADLIEEDEYIKWNENCKNVEFKAKVKPFIDWLSTAEEEE